MNNSYEVKLEINNQERCKTCLSDGRNLSPIGDYSSIFLMIMRNVPLSKYSPDMLLCWECISFLHNTLKFQRRVKIANEMLELQPSCLYTSLSTLSTAVVDKFISYQFFENSPIANDLEKESQNDVHDNINFDDNTIELEIDRLKEETENQNKEKKKYVASKKKWAEKRALENKKPKFKIRTDLKVKDVFIRKVDIDWEKEKDGACDGVFKCEACVMECDKGCSMDDNLRKAHKTKSGQYKTCKIHQKTIKAEHHLGSDTKSHCYKYVCKICDYQINKEERKKHLNEAHENVFQCVKCDLMFENRRHVLEHYKEMHEKFICDMCGVSFKMRYCIKLHIRRQHSPLQCNVCNRRFARYNSLWLHKKTHHNNHAQQAYCVECDKTYPDVYRYRYHLSNSVRHRAKKKVSIPCPGCDKVFSKPIYMKDHYDLVHLKNYKYTCEECNKNFIRNADLVKHRRRVHDGIRPPKDKMCYICGRGFATRDTLTNHIRTHTGERPYKCAHCPASFAQRVALLGHVKSLHKEMANT